MHKIVDVKVGAGYILSIVFDDGVQGTVDLSDLAGKGVFACWLDRSFFESVRIGSSGELVWGHSIDLCPDALYMRVTGKSLEEVFPRLAKI